MVQQLSHVCQDNDLHTREFMGMFKRLEGKNRRCLLMVSEGFLEEAERALGGGVKTREGLGTGGGGWRCRRCGDS